MFTNEDKMEGGWIYVLMTSSDYNRYKVGLTKNNPILRMNQLKTGDPKIGLVAVYFIPNKIGPLHNIEAGIHDLLGKPIMFHSGKESEWFVGNSQDIWLKIDIAFQILGYEVTDFLEQDTDTVVRLWEEDLIFLYNPPKTDEYGFPI